MRLAKLLYPLVFALALLSAQLGGAMHSVGHALSEQSQQDKQAPHHQTCEQCETYAQLGNALHGTGVSFALHATLSHVFSLHHSALLQSHTLAATARGPPALQITI